MNLNITLMMDEDIAVAAFFIIFGFNSYLIKQQTRIQRITTNGAMGFY